MKNIAIIPARSGSKGLKDKNIKILHGLPLMAYSIKAAIESKLFEEIMVSTDSEEYAKIARENGANVPFLRSEAMSSDIAGSWDVVKEVLNKYNEQGKRFDTVCLLQPTSPLRTSGDIIEGYKLYEAKCADAVTSVCETDHSPVWSMTLSDSLSLSEFREKTQDIPRQALDTYYRLNGAIYIRKAEYLKTGVEILSGNEYAYIMGRNRSIDIDTETDFAMADFMMSYENQTMSD